MNGSCLIVYILITHFIVFANETLFLSLKVWMVQLILHWLKWSCKRHVVILKRLLQLKASKHTTAKPYANTHTHDPIHVSQVCGRRTDKGVVAEGERWQERWQEHRKRQQWTGTGMPHQDIHIETDRDKSNSTLCGESERYNTQCTLWAITSVSLGSYHLTFSLYF